MSMEEPKRKFQGVWIPAAIWLDRSLSITEKVMLVEINSLQDDDRGCFKSNEQIATFFDLSKSRVSEIISSLADKDLVRVDLIREGKQIVERQIWMTETGRMLAGGVRPSSENTLTPLRKTRRPSSENKATLFGKGCDPSSEKAIESNTDSSNTKSNTESNKPSLLSEVDKQIASDFLKQRNAKNLPLTETALKGIKREADRLGYTLEQALTVCCERGWAGFKADWILKEQATGKNSKEQEKREATEQAKARLFGTNNEKDITHEATRL